MPLVVAPIRLALGILALAAAGLTGLSGERALVAFAFGTCVMMLAALADPRARLLQQRDPAEPVPAQAEYASRLEIARHAVFPSTVGVAVLAAIALVFGAILAAVLAGALAGMGLAAFVVAVQLAANERREGVELYAEIGGGRRRFTRRRDRRT